MIKYECLQNIEKTSTGLSTISERIRGIKGATEDGIGVAKLDEMMSVITSRYGQAVHVINESNGQLRSTYDILADLAKVWDRLSANEQQELGEKIAGKRQITVLNALLQNWQSVEVAIDNVAGSAGSAAREQQAYINSLTGAVAQLKATLQNMYAGALDSGMLTGLTKALTTAVKLVDAIGVGNLALGAMAGKFASLISPSSQVGYNIRTWLSTFKNLTSVTGEHLGIIQALGRKNLENYSAEQRELARLLILDSKRSMTKAESIRMSELKDALGKQEISQMSTLVALETTRKLLITGIVALSGVLVGLLVEAVVESNKAVSNALADLHSAEDNVEGINKRIEDLKNTIKGAGGAVTKEQQDELQDYIVQLRIANAELEKRQELAAAAINKQTQTFTSEIDVGSLKIGDEFSYLSVEFEELGKTITVTTSDAQKLLGNFGKVTKYNADEVAQYLAEIAPLKEELYSIDDDKLNAANLALKQMIQGLEEGLAGYIELEKSYLAEGFSEDAFAAKWDYFSEKIKSIEPTTEEIARAMEEFGISAEDAAGAFKDFELAQTILNSFGLSTDEALMHLQKLNTQTIEDFRNASTAIEATSRELKDYVDLYGQAVNGLTGKELLNIVQHWEEYIDVIKIENGELSISKDLVVEKAKTVVQSKINELKSSKADLETKLNALKAERAMLIAAEQSGTASVLAHETMIRGAKQAARAYIERNKAAAGATSTEYVKDTVDNSTQRIKELNDAIATVEAEIANTNKQIAYLESLNVEKYLAKAAAETKKAGSSTKSATKATKEANEELKKLQALLKALNDQLSKTSEVYKKVQSEMKKMVEEEKDGIEELNDGLEENIKYYEARVKLVQEALKKQIDAIKAEQKAAEEANDAVQKAIDARIKALKEETKTFEKNNKAQQDAIDEQVKALEEQIKAIDDANKSQEDALKVQEKLLEIEKARLALEKSKDAYEQAKKNKTVRTYDAQTGWTYTADQSLVQSAYADYTSAQSSYDDLLKEYAEMMAEAEREAQKAAIQAQIDALKDQKEGLQALLEQTKEAAEAEEESLNAQKDILKEQKEEIKNNFQTTLDKLDNQSDNLGDISDNVEKAVDKYLNDAEVQDWYNAYMNASEEERIEMMRALEGLWKTNLEQQNSNDEEIERLDKLIEEIDKMLDVDDYQVSTSEGVKEWLEDFKQVTYEDRRAMVSEMRDAYAEFYTSQQAQIEKVQEAIDKIEGNVNITTQLLKHWGTGTHNTPVNNYANGGVVDSGILSHTGMLGSNVKVHGTPQSPELILNGRQQANLLYRLAKQAPAGTTINNNGSNGSMYIANLNIQADSNDTLKGLLIQAKQLASIS